MEGKKKVVSCPCVIYIYNLIVITGERDIITIFSMMNTLTGFGYE